jgi:hypothetical protein
MPDLEVEVINPLVVGEAVDDFEEPPERAHGGHQRRDEDEARATASLPPCLETVPDAFP